MKTELTKDDIIKIAAQLRKPVGEQGTKIGERMNDGNGAMNLHTLAVLNPQPNDTILEIGMGNGYFVKNIVSQDPSIKYTGCDYSELMIEKASEINRKFIDMGNVNFVNANVQQLPFNDASYNKIFTINTFYFWDEHIKVLQELKRVLKKEGTLIIAIRPKHNLERFPFTRYGFSKFTTEEIKKLMESNGFNQIEITEIKEPKSDSWGESFSKETVILSCSYNNKANIS